MARPQRIHIREKLQALLPKSLMATLALDTGFVKRVRKLDLGAFLWSLVFGFGSGGDRAISALHDTYLSVASNQMNESSFGEWFRKPEFVPFMRGVVDHVLERLEEREQNERLGAELAQFNDLLCADSSLVRLHWSLQKAFPGTRTNHSPASLKVHLVRKVYGSGIGRIKITEGRRADSKTLPVGPWIRDNLLLIDLGYYDFAKFARIDSCGGYFISRVKNGANPLIVKSLLTHRGRAVSVEGEPLQNVLERFTRKVIDLQVCVRFQRRVYRGRRTYGEQTLRLVGVWNDDENKYHLYFTNLSPDQLSAEAIAEAYRLRWHVELIFRQLKSVHGMGKVRTLNEHAAVGLVYAAILSLLVTRRLIEAIEERFGLEPGEVTFERAARAVQAQASLLHRLVSRPPSDFGRLELDVEYVLCRKILNRNARNRNSLRTKTMNLMGADEPQTMAA